MAAVYRNLGIEFMYPENWALSQSEGSQLPLAVALESPDGSLWMLHVCSSQTRESDLIEGLIAEFSEQYEDFEPAAASQDIAGFHCHGVDAHFYCLDFLVTAQIRVVRTENYVIGLVSQAESRQFEKQSPVFAAMLTSLLGHCRKSGEQIPAPAAEATRSG